MDLCRLIQALAIVLAKFLAVSFGGTSGDGVMTNECTGVCA